MEHNTNLNIIMRHANYVDIIHSFQNHEFVETTSFGRWTL